MSSTGFDCGLSAFWDFNDGRKALAAPSLGLARAKGFVADANGGLQLVQVVGNSWSVTGAPAGVKSEGVVGIGVRERINPDRLQELLETFGIEPVEEKQS